MLILQIQDQDDVEIRLVAFAENSYPFVKLLYRCSCCGSGAGSGFFISPNFELIVVSMPGR